MMLRTKSGKNMYDMLSLLQKAIRRGSYKDAAYAANELESKYRGALWSRMLVISAEDCYGVLTKELISLKELDDESRNNEYIGKAIATMCKSLKSRDACYFSCNFVLDSRCPRLIELSNDEVREYSKIFGEEKKKEQYSEDGFRQLSLFDDDKECTPIARDIAIMHKAFAHRDMDMIGYQMDQLRVNYRSTLWEAFKYYVSKTDSKIMSEIVALEKADKFVNRNKKNGLKDEIFISKAAMLLCYEKDESIEDIRSSEIISLDHLIDWTQYKVRTIEECYVVDYEIPEWTFDCHTLKGKRMGKTDWDMTVDEQAALHPKKKAYFDEGSWLYTYMQDVRNGDLSEEGFEPIKKYALTHEANPVKFIPYD